MAKFTYKNIKTSVIKPRILHFNDYEDSKLNKQGITVKVDYDIITTELILTAIKGDNKIVEKLVVEYIPIEGISQIDQNKAEKLINEMCGKL
jgi:hypothetical protein